jgi:hypothetical protein
MVRRIEEQRLRFRVFLAVARMKSKARAMKVTLETE